MAPRIELRTTLTVRTVQCDDFMAHKVISGLQTRGDRVADAIVWVGHERCVTPLGLQPFGGAGKEARCGDFEPDGRTVGLVVLTT
jgi:hypothetical protein